MWKKIVALCLVLGLLVACGVEPTTQTATIQPPTAVSAVTEPSPTATSIVAEPTAMEPTAVPTQEPTPVIPTPTHIPTPQIPIQPSPTAIPNGGITLTYDHLATNIILRTIPAENAGASFESPRDNYPAHSRFRLVGYPLPDRRTMFYETQINVYPVPDYASINIYAAGNLGTLAQVLQERPSPDTITLFPLFYGMGIRYNTHYLDFANGSGIAYVVFAADFTAGVSPVYNEQLFYRFVGLTNDGQKYIALTLPISHAELPDNINSETFDDSAITANPDAYYSEIKTLLETSDPTAFTPPIASLDTLIQSLQIEPMPPLPAVNKLTIDYPLTYGQAWPGSALTIGGRTPTNETPIVAQLWAAGVRLAEGQTTAENGRWSVTMDVQPGYQGPATLQLTQDSESATIPFLIIHKGYYLDFPNIYSIANGTIFTEVSTSNPIGNSVTIGLLVDGCSRLVAQETFALEAIDPNPSLLSASGRIPIPADIEGGEHCLIAYMGQLGEGNWAASAFPISLPASTSESDSGTNDSTSQPADPQQ